MKLRNLGLAAAATAMLAAFGACKNDQLLSVAYTDQPDVARAFATGDGIEAILRNGFSQILNATHGSTTAILPAATVLSFESYGSVANFGMNLRAAIPRIAIDNSRGNPTAAEDFSAFQQLSLRGRTLANALEALDKLTANKGSLGSPAQDLRARSFGFFNLGIANAHMALFYDSVGVSTNQLASTDIPPLQDYGAAMTVALGQLDSAIAIATLARTATGTNGFPLPITWLKTPNTTSIDDYIKIIRSLKARYRAGVTRNATERAAVNWALVLADAQAGITSDFRLDMDNNAGWGLAWISQAMVLTGWHDMTPYIIGMADTSANYANWLAIDRNNRAPALILTPDKRFPGGETRTIQQTNSPASTAVLPTVYFRNRPAGEDTPGDAWGNSFYDFVRYRQYRQNSSIGPWMYMTRTENDMLTAEALIRLNRASEAVDLVNLTRVFNGLAPFPAGSSATSRAPIQPGGSATNCVPRTPTGAGGALECGTLFEAVKWEKRMETIFSGYAQWLQDSRGWGDLPPNTPTMWPVPFQEMDSRRQAFYNSLTGDTKWVAGATNTYGFGIGTR